MLDYTETLVKTRQGVWIIQSNHDTVERPMAVEFPTAHLHCPGPAAGM